MGPHRKNPDSGSSNNGFTKDNNYDVMNIGSLRTNYIVKRVNPTLSSSAPISIGSHLTKQNVRSSGLSKLPETVIGPMSPDDIPKYTVSIGNTNIDLHVNDGGTNDSSSSDDSSGDNDSANDSDKDTDTDTSTDTDTDTDTSTSTSTSTSTNNNTDENNSNNGSDADDDNNDNHSDDIIFDIELVTKGLSNTKN